MSKAIYIFLTDEQLKALEPLHEQVISAFDNDRPGSIFAQVLTHRECIKCRFLDTDATKKIQDAIGEIDTWKAGI